jgi:hypothetical protein
MLAAVSPDLNLRLERLEMSDPTVRAEYESAFYAAFQRVTGNRLIRKLWRWNHKAERLATRVPYKDQVIYALRTEDGRIDTAMAFNLKLRRFQSAEFGFALPQEPSGCVEILTFFSCWNHDFAVKRRFWAECLSRLRSLGLHTGYATSARHVLMPYLRMGFKLLADREIDGESRYFLQYRFGELCVSESGSQAA